MVPTNDNSEEFQKLLNLKPAVEDKKKLSPKKKNKNPQNTPSEIVIGDADKYKILALTAIHQRKHEEIIKPIVDRHKLQLQSDINNALSTSQDYLETQSARNLAINDFLRRTYETLPEDVYITHLKLDEGKVEYLIDPNRAMIARKNIGL